MFFIVFYTGLVNLRQLEILYVLYNCFFCFSQLSLISQCLVKHTTGCRNLVSQVNHGRTLNSDINEAERLCGLSWDLQEVTDQTECETCGATLSEPNILGVYIYLYIMN